MYQVPTVKLLLWCLWGTSFLASVDKIGKYGFLRTLSLYLFQKRVHIFFASGINKIYLGINMMRMHSILTYLDLGETQRISCGIYHLRQVVTVSCLLLFYQVYHGTHCSSWDQLRDETEPVSVWFELAWCLPARPYWSRWCFQRHSLCASCKIFQNEDILRGNSRVMSLLVSPKDSAVSHLT